MAVYACVSVCVRMWVRMRVCMNACVVISSTECCDVNVLGSVYITRMSFSETIIIHTKCRYHLRVISLATPIERIISNPKGILSSPIYE